MRDILFPFQEDALTELHKKINNAHLMWAEDNPQIISFTAPTGAGKTVIMTTLFEDILRGSIDNPADPDAVILWLSDSPELNVQTRMKIESKSDKLRVSDLVMIDSNFNREYLDGGYIYFLNTQKLGNDKLLTGTSDFRQYTIWETLTNTVKRAPSHVYVAIDEAHRGMAQTRQAQNKAQSIIQKFLKGSPEDGLCVMPLTIGITATPQRFESMAAGTVSTVQKVVVPAEAVRASGLLKDRIILHIPEMALMADMTTFAQAVDDWMSKCRLWEDYCLRENGSGGDMVRPILVVQVEDGSNTETTKTDLSSCLDVLEKQTGKHFQTGEIIHTFHDSGVLDYGSLLIPYVEASRIQEDERIQVVFFKMNLSTGWDCPRAETMMSFRGAQDYTFIAQLLGRMIRTPLARRIEGVSQLNDVSLFLPYFDKDTAQTVIDALRDKEAVFPGETGTSKQFITLYRDEAFADVFESMKDLVTYRIDAARKQPYLRLLVQLSRNLTMDDIDNRIQKDTRNAILSYMDQAITVMQEDGSYDTRCSQLTGFALGTITVNYGDNTFTYDEATKSLTVSDFDITNQFEQAGRILGEGLHKEYWVRHAARDYIEVQTEVIVLANDADFMERLEEFAKEKFLDLYDNCKRAISRLPEARKTVYMRMVNSSAQPVEIPWILPQSIDWSATDEDTKYENHLYLDGDGSFRAPLNAWESALVEEELRNGAVCWLRNVDRKKWALEIPYKVNGAPVAMYPDLIMVRADASGYVFDILEPHDPSRKDNCPKAVGLAEFAKKHWDKYGKIQLIRKQKGPDGREHFYRLDMAKTIVCNKVLGITTNTELDRIFAENAERED